MKKILDHDGIVLYEENYCSMTMDDFLKDLIWRNDSITMFGKTYPQPRQTAFHGDPGLHYTYSKIKMISPGWTPALLKLKKKLEKDLDTTFNSVLINYYRDGADHMSYHADNEPELGMNPTVAAVSFGAIRKFHLKHRYEKTRPPIIIELADQSLLVMKGELQHNWLHKISKSKKVLGPRLSLTFRLLRSFL